MDRVAELQRCAPKDLAKARAIGHKLVQFVTLAARANLKPEPDDSHSNIGWDNTLRGFLSQPLNHDGTVYFVGASLHPLKLCLLRNQEVFSTLEMDGVSESNAARWLDAGLQQLGMKPASEPKLPYELPPAVATVDSFSAQEEGAALSTLSDWFDTAHSLLSEFAAANVEIDPGPSPVRCWPHHFDIATYVSLEHGDFETAKGIGVGLSPGDESYDQPYFYINPFPHLDACQLPGLPAPGHWHKEGFVGAIATADEILSSPEPVETLKNFVNSVFSIGRQKLGV